MVPSVFSISFRQTQTNPADKSPINTAGRALNPDIKKKLSPLMTPYGPIHISGRYSLAIEKRTITTKNRMITTNAT